MEPITSLLRQTYVRVFVVLAILVVVVSIAAVLAGDDGGEGLSAAPPGPELLRLSDEAMAGLRSLHVEVTLFPPEAPAPGIRVDDPEVYEMDLLDRRCVKSDLAGAECSCDAAAGTWPYFDRVQGGQVYGPPFLGATTAENVRVIGVGLIQDSPMWVLAYEFENPSVEGTFKVERQEWIDQETYVLRRQDEENHDPFGAGGTIRSEIGELNEFEGCR